MNTLCDKFCLLTVYCGGKVTGRERKIFQSISGNMKNSADNATIHLTEENKNLVKILWEEKI